MENVFKTEKSPLQSMMTTTTTTSSSSSSSKTTTSTTTTTATTTTTTPTFDIKCFQHSDGEICSFCEDCKSPVCLVCMCSIEHKGHSFSLISQKMVQNTLDAFKIKTYNKSQRYKEKSRKRIQMIEQQFQKIKLNHQSNMSQLTDKFKQLHQILQILEIDIKRTLETLLTDNEELYLKTKSLLDNEVQLINSIITKHSTTQSPPTIPPIIKMTDYNINQVYNQSTKQHLSIIKDNYQLLNIIKDQNNYEPFKETTLLFNNDIIDNIKSTLKTIYSINQNALINNNNKNNNNSNDDEDSGEESDDEEKDENKDENISSKDIKPFNDFSTLSLLTTKCKNNNSDNPNNSNNTNNSNNANNNSNSLNILPQPIPLLSSSSTSSFTSKNLNSSITNNQENNKLYQFKIHYREVYNLPIRVEAFLISSQTLSPLEDDLEIMVIVSPKDIQNNVPKGTKIMFSNKFYGSQSIEIPNTLSLHSSSFMSSATTTIAAPQLQPITTTQYKQLITFNQFQRNLACSFQPMLNIKIQFPSDIGVSYFSYMYPNISWYLGDLKPIKRLTIGLEGCSSSGKTSLIMGLINLFNLSSTIQQNFSEEHGGSTYFQTNRITYRSIKSIIDSNYSNDPFSNSFLSGFDISFLDTWGLCDNDIELKYKVQGRVYNNLAINEKSNIGSVSKPEFSVNLFLFVVSIKSFKCIETMRKMEKRMNESISLGITPILAITFSDQVSTPEYTSLISSYNLPVQPSNIFKIINYNDLEIRKDLEKDLLYFRLINRMLQICKWK
ncbi:hypothetical protein ACTFIU_004286 [Dictyostelium citrinum]